MAAEHFFAKAWSLSFERFSQKIRDFLKNLLLMKSVIYRNLTCMRRAHYKATELYGNISTRSYYRKESAAVRPMP